jgi:hypothetical protein
MALDDEKEYPDKEDEGYIVDFRNKLTKNI